MIEDVGERRSPNRCSPRSISSAVTTSAGISRTTLPAGPQVSVSSPCAGGRLLDGSRGRGVGSAVARRRTRCPASGRVPDVADRVVLVLQRCASRPAVARHARGRSSTRPSSWMTSSVAQRRGRRDRVAAVRAALRPGPALGHQLGRRGDRADRETGRDALGGDQDVRRGRAVLVAPELRRCVRSRPAPRRGSARCRACRPARAPFEERRRCRQVAAVAEHRLDEEGGGVVRRGPAQQQIVEFAQRELHRGLPRPSRNGRRTGTAPCERRPSAGRSRPRTGFRRWSGSPRRRSGRGNRLGTRRCSAGRSPSGPAGSPPSTASEPELA